MADTLRESLPKLPKAEPKVSWKPKNLRGVISQANFETSRGKKASFKPA